MNKLFLILTLASLACGTLQPAQVKATYAGTQAETEVSTAVKMTVTGSLNIRADHTEKSDDIGDLFRGQTVTCNEFVTVGDSVWCKHELGWSNAHWLRMVEEKEGR